MSVDTSTKTKSIDFCIEASKTVAKEDQLANLKNHLEKIKKLAATSKFEAVNKPTKVMSASAEAKSLGSLEESILKTQTIVESQGIEATTKEKVAAISQQILALQKNAAVEQVITGTQQVKAKSVEQFKEESKLDSKSKAKSADGGKFKASCLNPASAQSKVLEMKAQETSDKTTGALPVEFGSFQDDVGYASADALLALTWKSDTITDWEDDVVENKKKGDELIRLFYYYARLAASGDMGAIYQFLKFITYIISKDKAKQTIELGKKLIVMQEWSRTWTNKLLDVETDPNNASSSSELMKTMTLVKSETDAIASSMKLLSQTMESFSTDIETMTNVAKNAAEAHARIMRKVSAT